ncbi:hypothetical protein LCGC14_0372150 [marine sediment metagenome]|uniref:Uncharacterized protein n=1 Tax=marine sediment metagenome TaxID=412755 RepID=A0A0F9TAH4_9ZZZZ
MKTPITDWFIRKGVLMDPVVIEFMEATNKMEVKFKMELLEMNVIENE